MLSLSSYRTMIACGCNWPPVVVSRDFRAIATAFQFMGETRYGMVGRFVVVEASRLPTRVRRSIAWVALWSVDHVCEGLRRGSC